MPADLIAKIRQYPKTAAFVLGSLSVLALPPHFWLPVLLVSFTGLLLLLQNNVSATQNSLTVTLPQGEISLVLTERDGGFRFLVPEKGRQVECTVWKSAKDDPRLLQYWNVEKQQFEVLPCTVETDTTKYYDNVPDPALIWYAPLRRAIGHRVGIVAGGRFLYSGKL